MKCTFVPYVTDAINYNMHPLLSVTRQKYRMHCTYLSVCDKAFMFSVAMASVLDSAE